MINLPYKETKYNKYKGRALCLLLRSISVLSWASLTSLWVLVFHLFPALFYSFRVPGYSHCPYPSEAYHRYILYMESFLLQLCPVCIPSHGFQNASISTVSVKVIMLIGEFLLMHFPLLCDNSCMTLAQLISTLQVEYLT